MEIGAAVLLFVLAYPYWLCHFKRYMVGRHAFGEVRGQLDIKCSAYYMVFPRAILFLLLLVLLLQFVIFVVPYVQNLFADASGLFVSIAKVIFTILLLLVATILYLYFFAIIKVGVSNQTWSHSTLGPVSFRSTMTPWGLTMLYLTNTLAIYFSFGLLIPWAVIRTLRYRIENLHLQLEEDLDQVVAAAAAPVRAAGAEVGDIFDIDLSI